MAPGFEFEGSGFNYTKSNARVRQGERGITVTVADSADAKTLDPFIGKRLMIVESERDEKGTLNGERGNEINFTVNGGNAKLIDVVVDPTI